MKTTKRQLRRIIKEEKRKLLGEGIQSQEEAFFLALDKYVMALEDEGYMYDPEDGGQIKMEVLNFVDGYFFDRDFQNPSGKV